MPNATPNVKIIPNAEITLNTSTGSGLVRKLDYPKVFAFLLEETKSFLDKNNFSQVVLGLSGGLDSALVATIAAEALGKKNVLGVMLESEFTSRESLEDAEALSKNLGIDYKTISISPVFEQAKQSLAELFVGYPSDNTEENMQARVRSLLLMSISNKFRMMLLNTSNKSEINTGYSTLYGDSCGAISVIGDLYKTEVFAMSFWYNSTKKMELIPNNIITKAPSAELRPNQKDADSLPDYAILDPILEQILSNKVQDNPLFETVNSLYKRSLFKQAQFPPIIKIDTML